MDFGLINDDHNIWENVYDLSGNRVDLNVGAITTTDSGKHIVDNRIYLYVSRLNNTVKEGSGLDMNSIDKDLGTVDVYLKGA